MKNESLFAELKAMSENINKLETETDRAVSNMKTEINDARTEKANNIASFLEDIYQKFMYMNGQKIDVDTGINSLVVRFIPKYGVFVNDGHYYGIVELKHGRLEIGDCIYENKKYFKAVYTLFVDSWNENVMERIENSVAKQLKKQLAERSENAAQKLKEANDEYNAYFNKN